MTKKHRSTKKDYIVSEEFVEGVGDILENTTIQKEKVIDILAGLHLINPQGPMWCLQGWTSKISPKGLSPWHPGKISKFNPKLAW